MGIEDKIDLESEGGIEAVKIQNIPLPKDENELVNYFRNIRKNCPTLHKRRKAEDRLFL